MTINKQIQLLEKLTNKKVVLENDFFKKHILSKEEKLEKRLNSIKGILIKGGTYKGDLDLEDIKELDSLYNLERVEGSLYLKDTLIKDLGKLEYVRDGLWLSNTQTKDLGKLKHVGSSLDLRNTPIKDLGNLKRVERYIYINSNTPLYHNEELIEEYEEKGIDFLIS